MFPNKLVPNISNSTPRNPSFCSYVSVSIVCPTPFINKPKSSRVLSIFLIFSIPSFDIMNVIFLSIPTSAVDASAVNSNDVKTILANS